MLRAHLAAAAILLFLFSHPFFSNIFLFSGKKIAWMDGLRTHVSCGLCGDFSRVGRLVGLPGLRIPTEEMWGTSAAGECLVQMGVGSADSSVEWRCESGRERKLCIVWLPPPDAVFLAVSARIRLQTSDPI